MRGSHLDRYIMGAFWWERLVLLFKNYGKLFVRKRMKDLELLKKYRNKKA